MKGRAAAIPHRAGVRGGVAGIAATLRALLALIALIAPCTPASAQVSGAAAADFTVSDIKVEGLQRVSEGTVYNYLPVNIGDHLTPQRVREAIRALYATCLLYTSDAADE